MAFIKSVAFVNDILDGDDGKIYITVQDSDAIAGPFNVFISVIDPNGNYVHQSTGGPSGGAEISLPEGDIGAFSVNIPLTDTGEYLGGQYSVQITIWDVSPSSQLETNTGVYTYEPHVSPGSMASDDVDFISVANCITGIITCTDNTENNGLASPSRTITVTPPSESGEEVTTQSLDDDNRTVEVSFGFTNCVYGTSVVVRRQLDSDYVNNNISFVTNERLAKTINLSIACDTSACDIAACMEEEFDALNTLACNGAGWGQLTNAQKARFEYASNLYLLAVAYDVLCNDKNKAGEKIDQLKEFLNCGCGCDDEDPVPYIAPGAND